MTNNTIALAGNPNSGKTTMFNALTGARQHVGNYPGVTVEKKEGHVDYRGKTINVVDLPGTYSLTAYSMEELAARNFLVDEKPTAVVNIVDANILERSLYLAVQLLEMGVPMVVALNMMDEVRRKNMAIDSAQLSRLLGVPVVETVARDGEGKNEILREAMRVAAERGGEWKPLEISYGDDIDGALMQMAELIEESGFLTDRFFPRWLALKYLEGDEEIMRLGRKVGGCHNELERIAGQLAEHFRKTLNTYPEAVIADYRYGFISSLLREGVVRINDDAGRIAISDKIDKVVTNAFFGPLIMFGILYAMFQLTFVVGEIPMGWLEDFFGWLGGTVEAALPDGQLRSLLVSGVIDGVGGVMGFVPLIVVMFAMLTTLEDMGYMARMAYMLDRVLRMFGLHGSSVMPFIISGGIPGGCAVPGVMAARTLRSPKERLVTILTAPLLSCGAKVPVFMLLVAAFFPEDAGNVMFLITLAAWAIALLTARLLRSTIVRGESTPFIMELPPYRIPTFRGVVMHTWERAWQYIKKAGTVLLAITILLWAAMTYPQLPEDKVSAYEAQKAEIQAQVDEALTAGVPAEEQLAELENRLLEVENLEAEATLRHSFAGRAGVALEGISKWAGFDWRTNIALVGGFAAKEVIVSTLGTAYSLGDVDPEEAEPLSARLAADPGFTSVTAISLILFTLIYAPCVVTVVSIARETSWKWAGFAVGFNTIMAFGLSVLVYQIGVGLG